MHRIRRPILVKIGLKKYPEPMRASFSYISLQSVGNRLHEKQKVCSFDPPSLIKAREFSEPARAI